jgi:hypothetical protein
MPLGERVVVDQHVQAGHFEIILVVEGQSRFGHGEISILIKPESAGKLKEGRRNEIAFPNRL